MEASYKCRDNHKKIFTHFLHLETNSNQKYSIVNFNKNIDVSTIKNCINGIYNKDHGIHSILVLCEYISMNPLQVLNILSIADINTLFGYVKVLETQKQTLSAICFILQLIQDNIQIQELITRNEFYSHLKTLIESPTDNPTQQLALCCALYSLEISQSVRMCMLENEVFDVIMHANMQSDNAEYLRARFFKMTSKTCGDFNDVAINQMIKFLFILFNSSDRIIKSMALIAIDNTFSYSLLGISNIQDNKLIYPIIECLNDKEPKLRRSAATIIYSLIQSNSIRQDEIKGAEFVSRVLEASKYNDSKTSSTCFNIIKYILQDFESNIFDLFEITEMMAHYNYLELFTNSSFEIKIDFLTVLNLLVYDLSPEQIDGFIHDQTLRFLSDLIHIGNCGVASDISYILSTILNKSINDDVYSFIESILEEDGALQQLLSLSHDPSISPKEVDHINSFLSILNPNT